MEMNVNNPTPLEPATPPSPEARKMNWLLFLIVLLAPAIASCLAGAVDSRNGNVAPVIALFGGSIAGIICGAMLGRRLGKATDTRLWLGILFALIMAVVCIGMSCFGCMAGGYQMRFG